jgi:signal transduction histidine kinase
MTGPGWTRRLPRADTVGPVTTTVPRRLAVRRLRRGELIALDGVLAVGLVALCGYAAAESAWLGEPRWLSIVTGLVLGAPLAVRRLWPVTVTGVVLAASAAALMSGIIPGFAAAAPSMALACALYIVGATVPGRRSALTLAICVIGIGAAVAVAVVVDTPSADLPDVGDGIAVSGVTAVTAWTIGWTLRERRAHARQAAELRARRAIGDERLRIARELHDVVAHSMSVIVVKAAVGNHVAESSPQEAREALRVIEATSRDALAEIRRTLGALRGDEAPMRPAPGLADLDELADTARAGGVEVTLDRRGDANLPAAIGLSVYRIVQESLTNVVKHAAPARCRVLVEVDEVRVRIEVVDDGRRASDPSAASGHGLIGIRERVEMYGGELLTGPRRGGGFVVDASLPLGWPA